ncbi:small protein B [Pelagophyceae sp. CCMP2097]|nr:small protein B [Pelagophyceae sp. CCMP2097]
MVFLAAALLCLLWARAGALGPPAGVDAVLRAPATALRAAPTTSGQATSKPNLRRLTVASNRKARFEYEIIDTFEAGIELVGTEVKSCRQGKISLRDGFGQVKGNTVWLHNVDIAQHETTGPYFQHEPKRMRRLLLHKREAQKLARETDVAGNTLIPLQFYFNEKNLLKVQIALCKGKNQRDKRDTIKERDDKKMMQRIVKNL